MIARDRESPSPLSARRCSTSCRGGQAAVFAPRTRTFPRNHGMAPLASATMTASPSSPSKRVLRANSVSSTIEVGPAPVFDPGVLRRPLRSIYHAERQAAYRRQVRRQPHQVLELPGLRLWLRNSEVVPSRLRAVIRSSPAGGGMILFSLVFTPAELRDARTNLEHAAVELRAEENSICEKPPVGIAIEVSAAAILANHTAKEVVFLSIGTDDLIQYTPAESRTDATVADLYCAVDSTVLRSTAKVVSAARRHENAVSVCGTMRGDARLHDAPLGLDIEAVEHASPPVAGDQETDPWHSARERLAGGREGPPSQRGSIRRGTNRNRAARGRSCERITDHPIRDKWPSNCR